MKIFGKRAKKEHRSFDEIVTPKSEKETEECVEDDASRESAKVAEEEPFNAVGCFGWSEGKTPNFLIKCATFWYWAISFFWFIFGALTFAPVIFIRSKVRVLFNNDLYAFLASIGIYLVCFSLFLIILI